VGKDVKTSSRSLRYIAFDIIVFGPTPILVMNFAAFRSDHHSEVSREVKKAFVKTLSRRAVRMIL
jgi:hypothetical protein